VRGILSELGIYVKHCYAKSLVYFNFSWFILRLFASKKPSSQFNAPAEQKNRAFMQ
jgi:hypothetical protein